MDKWTTINNGADFLKIKIGINAYRCVIITLFALTFICSILYIIYTKKAVEITISFVLSLIFLTMAVFADKLISALKLPTDNLLVYKDKIIYVKKKKQIIFETNKIQYKFHSFFDNFESLSQLEITDSNNTYYFLITKRQFKAIEKFLQI